MKISPQAQQIRRSGPKVTQVQVNSPIATFSMLSSEFKQFNAKVKTKHRAAALIAQQVKTILIRSCGLQHCVNTYSAARSLQRSYCLRVQKRTTVSTTMMQKQVMHISLRDRLCDITLLLYSPFYYQYNQNNYKQAESSSSKRGDCPARCALACVPSLDPIYHPTSVPLKRGLRLAVDTVADSETASRDSHWQLSAGALSANVERPAGLYAHQILLGSQAYMQ